VSAAYSQDSTCYNCIQNDYIYCVLGEEHAFIAKGKPVPQGICCRDLDSCLPASNPEWSCSSVYADKILSLRVCPFKAEVCGDSKDIIFGKTGDNKNSNLQLLAGDVCLYNIHAQCGNPAFTPAGSDVSKLDIFFIEYDDHELYTEEFKITSSTPGASVTGRGVQTLYYPHPSVRLDIEASDPFDYDIFGFRNGPRHYNGKYYGVAYQPDGSEVSF
jgi:hypothetical protein